MAAFEMLNQLGVLLQEQNYVIRKAIKMYTPLLQAHTGGRRKKNTFFYTLRSILVKWYLWKTKIVPPHTLRSILIIWSIKKSQRSRHPTLIPLGGGMVASKLLIVLILSVVPIWYTTPHNTRYVLWSGSHKNTKIHLA